MDFNKGYVDDKNPYQNYDHPYPNYDHPYPKYDHLLYWSDYWYKDCKKA